MRAAARRVPLALIGTPEEIVAEICRRERELGVTLMLLSGTRRDATMLARFVREVMPQV